MFHMYLPYLESMGNPPHFFETKLHRTDQNFTSLLLPNDFSGRCFVLVPHHPLRLDLPQCQSFETLYPAFCPSTFPMSPISPIRLCFFLPLNLSVPLQLRLLPDHVQFRHYLNFEFLLHKSPSRPFTHLQLLLHSHYLNIDFLLQESTSRRPTLLQLLYHLLNLCLFLFNFFHLQLLVLQFFHFQAVSHLQHLFQALFLADFDNNLLRHHSACHLPFRFHLHETCRPHLCQHLAVLLLYQCHLDSRYLFL